MRVKQTLCRALFLIMGMTFGLAKVGHAYLDPGSGSYVFQMIIAGLVGGVFAIKMCWVRIKTSLKCFFARNR